MTQVIVITGVAAGLGRELFHHATAGGHRVVGLDHALVTDVPEGASFRRCDLRDAAQIRDVVAQIIREDGPLDVLVNNAAMGTVTPLEACQASFVADLVAVNLTAPLLLAQNVLPTMRARGRGRIVNVSSISCVASVPGTSTYAASKSALEKASRILAAELRGSGVSVGVVRLGRMQTESYVRVGEALRANLERDAFHGYEPILDMLWGVIGNTSLGMPPADVAEKLLEFALGARASATIAPFEERMQIGLSSFLPESVLNALLAFMGRRHRRSELALPRSV